MVTISEIFNALSDDNSLMLFNAIASGSEELLPKLTITEKWCSSIISSLLEVGLVRKQEDKYYLTSVGRIFYHAYIMAEDVTKLIIQIVYEKILSFI